MAENDDLIRNEEEAAAAEAGEIGGPAPDYDGPEEAVPLEESGQGVAEGFEESERELEEQATHGEGGGVPEGFTPEEASDESGAEYGEPDEVDSPDG